MPRLPLIGGAAFFLHTIIEQIPQNAQKESKHSKDFLSKGDYEKEMEQTALLNEAMAKMK